MALDDMGCIGSAMRGSTGQDMPARLARRGCTRTAALYGSQYQKQGKLMRVLIHPGFHKTGTKSVQLALETLRPDLPKGIIVALQAELADLCDICREVSVSPEVPLDEVERLATERFALLGQAASLLIISAEDLAGALPGRRGITHYTRTPELMGALTRAAHTALNADVHLHFSTRGAEAWLISLWWQNLRSTRLTASADVYAQEMAEAAHLDRVVAAVRSAVPQATVSVTALEDCSAQPVLPILRAADLAHLAERLPPQHANARPDLGLEEVFLALNRSGLRDGFVRDTKTAILRKARRMTGT